MSAIRFSQDHEWVRLEDDGSAVVGITHYAQDQLGDIVFVELPEVGREFKQGDDAAVVESVKAASDVKMPLSGTVTEVNEVLSDSPESVNQDPLGDGWFMKIKPAAPDEFESLMSEDSYREFIAQ